MTNRISPVAPCLETDRTAGCADRRPPSVIDRLARLLGRWRRRVAETRELAALSDRDLRDMGVNRYELEHELRRPTWKHWP
jgi:uncharacterized protein YjiS (DUF1127 family)